MKHLINIARMIVVASLVMSLPSVSFAQNKTGKKQSGLAIVKTDSLPELIQQYLHETSSKHFEDPRVPRFLIKDRTGNYVFGVGGSVGAKLFYDYDGYRGDAFTMNKEDVSHDNGNDVVDFDLTSTNISFKVLGLTKYGVIDAFINANFSGVDGALKIQYAYLDAFGLRVGMANTGFNDDESLDFIDADAVLSNTGGRQIPQISYSHRFKNGMRIQGGLEFPQGTTVWSFSRAYATSDIYPVASLVPDVTANWFYTTKQLHLYAGVNSSFQNYYDEADAFRGEMIYAFQLSGNYAFYKTERQSHKIYAQGIWTHGMGDYCRVLRKKGLNAIMSADDFDKPKDQYCVGVPNVLGGSVGYQAKFGLNTIDIMYSHVNVSGHEVREIPDAVDWAHSAAINYMRKIFSYGTVGAECIFGRKTDLAGKTYTNIRSYVYLRYDF